MNKRIVYDEILRSINGFRCESGYFFSEKFDHILRGFHCEFVPGGVYVWRFVYPLYDNFDALNLLYSERLTGPGAYYATHGISSRELGVLLANSVLAEVSQFHSIWRIDDFLSYCKKVPGVMDNAHGQFVYGLSMILLGDFDGAKLFLRNIRHLLRAKDGRYCDQIVLEIEADRSGVVDLVLSQEHKMRRVLRLT